VKLKDYPLLVLAIPLGLAFVIVCSLLFVVNKNHPGLVRAKMRIGALLLGLGYFTACSTPPPDKTCYKPAINYMQIDSIGEIAAGDSLHGKISFLTYDTLYYEIKAASDQSTVDSGNFKSNKAGFTKEDFWIVTDKNLGAGSYILSISGKYKEIDTVDVLIQDTFKVK
jgi:hypothetical protein